MSELDRIANLLRETIKSRQVLAIGEAQFAAVQGQSALFTAASGTISAIATNHCYGKCLLHKVEGVWYALNPAEGGVKIRSSVDRQIWRRPKSGDDRSLPKISIIPGIKTTAGGGYYSGGGGTSVITYPAGAVSIPEDGGSLMFKFELEQALDENATVSYQLSGSAILGVNYSIGAQTPPVPVGFTPISGDYVVFEAGQTILELELVPIIATPRLPAPVAVTVEIVDENYDPDPIAATADITTRLFRSTYSNRVSSNTSAPACSAPNPGYVFASSESLIEITYHYIDPEPTYVGFVKFKLKKIGNPPLLKEFARHNAAYGNTQQLLGFVPYLELIDGAYVNRIANFDAFGYLGEDPIADFDAARNYYLAEGYTEQIFQRWDVYCNYVEN